MCSGEAGCFPVEFASENGMEPVRASATRVPFISTKATWAQPLSYQPSLTRTVLEDKLLKSPKSMRTKPAHNLLKKMLNLQCQSHKGRRRVKK